LTSNKLLAKAYLRDAEYSYREALKAYEDGLYHRVIRRSQEAVELSLKALLRYFTVEYPRSHDVSPVLYRIKDILPSAIKNNIQFISNLSLKLSIERGPAFYGDEDRAIPPSKLYNKNYAETILRDVGRLLSIIKEAIT